MSAPTIRAPTPTHPPDLHVDAQIRIDEEIAQLEERIVSLKVAPNAKGETSLLIASVSHAWRELAQHTSALWSYIDFQHPEWVEAALSLTKNRVLEFNLVYRKVSYSIPLISLCLRNLPRIAQLNLILGHTQSLPVSLTAALMIPAPVLVHLYLGGFSIPRNVFSGSFSSLQSLRLSSCAVDWDTLPVPPGLNQLVITDPGSRTTIDHMMKILQVIGPDLEKLRLQNVFSRPPIASSASGLHTFRFNRLGLLILSEDSPKAIAVLLGHISLPTRLTIEIHIGIWQESNLIQALISSRNLERWPLDSLQITADRGTVTLSLAESLKASTFPDGSDEKEENGKQTYIMFRIRFGAPSQVFPVLQLLPIHPIRAAFFIGGSDTGILEYIGKMGTVQQLCIWDTFLDTFFTFIRRQFIPFQRTRLIPEKSEELDGPPRETAAQSILSFRNMFELQISGDRKHTLTGLTRQQVMILRDWCHWRKSSDLPMESLILSKMVIPSVKWVKELFGDLVRFDDVVEEESEV
ncbi:hypothetical protein BDN72DRAFT_857477 [Pluteus cervinus]|uniref:Uncharacterized protein n=1 Tax=Pluteus cervinus TaxID=181527 RepID=A0ACD3AUT8_9AGAR|nr:hypothetical protein BDN72DRAFT_857477 [Pluteus cervinus]